ncbi:MAG: AzlC family ABC transporter permease [Clostridiales bacterium]|nr:AzlC family ABC transporter permease [Clostridiales bacterium]
MESNFSYWKRGLCDGIPIALGYLAVSFTFGIAAKEAGITVLQAVIMSATNLTSAGQFAALGLIRVSAGYFEMAITQLIINLRYSLMSCVLCQKLSNKTAFIHRFFVATGVTDEIFGISAHFEGKLNPYYTYGVISVAVPGWTLGTFLGVLSGNLIPDRILSALSVALYGMFLAVIIPPAKENKIIAGIILISMLLSLIFTKLPLLKLISPGFKIIILTVVIAGIAAILFPVEEGDINGE